MTEADVAAVVRQIVAFNDAWKAVGMVGGFESQAARELRDAKALLQVRLLREKHAYLRPDSDGHDDLWSVRLRRRVDGRTDACHLPRHVAEALLLPVEIVKYAEAADVG